MLAYSENRIETVSHTINAPIDCIQRIFERNISQIEGQLRADADFGIIDHFVETFKMPQSYNQIPYIENKYDLSSIPDASLVRFRCMVQDNGFSPEIYQPFIQQGEVWTCYKYGCGLSNMEHQYINTTRPLFADRQLFMGVGVPCEAKWTKNIKLSSEGDALSERFSKLTVESDQCNQPPKLLVKVYCPADFRLNEVVEIIGVLDKESSPSVIHTILFRRLKHHDHPEFLDGELSGSAEGYEFSFFDKVVDNKESDLKSTYSLTWKLNEQTLLGAISKYAPELVSPVLNSFTIDTIRSELVRYIADSAFLGDSLVAEYVLMWLLARTYRQTPDLSLGNLSLTISRCPYWEDEGEDVPSTSKNMFSKTVNTVLGSLLPKSLMIPLRIEYLNEASFIPKAKTEDVNVDDFFGVLQPGLLQLSDGTFLILDETSMSEGQLKQTGIRNIAALQQILIHQSLYYDLQEPICFDKKVNVLVLCDSDKTVTFSGSKEKQSLLPTDITVPLSKSSLTYNKHNAEHHPWVPLFRMFLAYFRVAGSPSHEYQIPEEMSKRIENEFVQQRRQAAETNQILMSDQELLRLLGLARLHALSWGRTELNSAMWERVKVLERTRKARFDDSLGSSFAGH